MTDGDMDDFVHGGPHRTATEYAAGRSKPGNCRCGDYSQQGLRKIKQILRDFRLNGGSTSSLEAF